MEEGAGCPFPDMDDSPWEPSADFNDVYVRVNEKGECVVSGPQELVDAMKQKVLTYLSKGQQEKMPMNIERIVLKSEV